MQENKKNKQPISARMVTSSYYCWHILIGSLYQGVPDHPKVSPEPFSLTKMIIVLCLEVLDSFGKMSREDMKNKAKAISADLLFFIKLGSCNILVSGTFKFC